MATTPPPAPPSPTLDLATTRAPVATPRPLPDGGGHGRAIVTATWGAGAGQLGHRRDPESVSEGPMSFIVGKTGAIVLDNVNARLARFDRQGKPLPPIALPNAAAQDLAPGPRDGVAVLDRLRDKSLTLYDRDGSPGPSVPLVGAGVSEAGGVTGVFAARDGDLYIEREHTAWLRLIDGAGNLDASRRAAPGRPTRDGRFVSAAIVDRAAGRIRLQLFNSDGSPAWSEAIDCGAPIMYIALLDSDAAGDLFIAAHTGHESAAPPYRITDETLVAIALGPSGGELGRLTLPAPPPPDEAFRDLYVGDDGTLYWMRRTPAGVEIMSYRLF
jgi:hypothetical protein